MVNGSAEIKVKTSNRNKEITILILLIFFILVLMILVYFFLRVFLPKLPCRNDDSSPKFTGFSQDSVSEYGDENFKAWTVTTCIADVKASESTIILKLGFFDKYWIMHTYDAKLGSNQNEVGLCKDSAEGNSCGLVNISELQNQIKKGDLIDLFLVVKDTKNTYLDKNTSVNKYDMFYSSLSKALINKREFPKMPNFDIPISQVYIKL